jgi:hypothetical protein
MQRRGHRVAQRVAGSIASAASASSRVSRSAASATSALDRERTRPCSPVPGRADAARPPHCGTAPSTHRGAPPRRAPQLTGVGAGLRAPESPECRHDIADDRGGFFEGDSSTRGSVTEDSAAIAAPARSASPSRSSVAATRRDDAGASSTAEGVKRGDSGPASPRRGAPAARALPRRNRSDVAPRLPAAK